MNQLLTIIVILHNRHRNLDRLLEFYADSDLPIVIADSSTQPHVFNSPIKATQQYIYKPGISYTQKVEHIIPLIKTPYVAMCADDDFLIPDGLAQCVNFLERNSDYTSAQGLILKYYQDSVLLKLRLDSMYNGDFTLAFGRAVERVKKLFEPYKSLLYAVHRTAILQDAFEGAGTAFTNLYLNEYLVSIVPILHGRHKDLHVLYQVREHAEVSDDKVTDNIDKIMAETKYIDESTNFFQFIFSKIPSHLATEAAELNNTIFSTLKKYGETVRSFAKKQTSLKKRLGTAIHLLPFVGPAILRNRRQRESMRALEGLITAEEWTVLRKIEILLKKYAG